MYNRAAEGGGLSWEASVRAAAAAAAAAAGEMGTNVTRSGWMQEQLVLLHTLKILSATVTAPPSL